MLLCFNVATTTWQHLVILICFHGYRDIISFNCSTTSITSSWKTEFSWNGQAKSWKSWQHRPYPGRRRCQGKMWHHKIY